MFVINISVPILFFYFLYLFYSLVSSCLLLIPSAVSVLLTSVFFCSIVISDDFQYVLASFNKGPTGEILCIKEKRSSFGSFCNVRQQETQ